MKPLILHVKREFFEQIRRGEKTEEYRLVTPYWKSRLECKDYSEIVICLGYPSKTDINKRITFPWKGFIVRIIQHKHFGNSPVLVYAIQLYKHTEEK